MDHIIHKMQWNVGAVALEQKVELEQELSAIANSSIFLQSLEATLDKVSPKNEMLSIDRLDLNIGALDEKDWQESIVMSLLSKLEKELWDLHKDEKSKLTSLPKYATDTFFRLIEMGNLPGEVPNSVLTLDDFFAWSKKQHATAKGFFLKVIIKKLNVDRSFLEKLISWPLSTIWHQIMRDSESSVLKAETEKKIVQLDRVLDFNESHQFDFRRAVWHLSLKQKALGADYEKVLEVSALKVYTNAPNHEKKQLKRTISNDKLQKALHDFVNLETQKEKVQGAKEEKAGVESRLHIKNAGFVLVAAFIPKLFEQCALIKNKEITNHRAALKLLEVLNYGTKIKGALDLALFKVLLGIDISEIMLPNDTLKKEHKEEIKDLLSNLINHWKALKNTSPQGLREGFFKREGVLTEEADRFNLVVETKAQDVLLSYLPWSIGVIKLPWMRKPLHVDWT